MSEAKPVKTAPIKGRKNGNKRRRQPFKNNGVRKAVVKNENKKPIPSVDYVSGKGYGESQQLQKIFANKASYERWAELVNTLGASGPDIRKASESLNMSGFFVDSADESNKIAVPINTTTLLGIATAIISHAYNHGYRQQTLSDSHSAYPYYAMVFIYNALISVAQGNQQDVPKCKFPDFLLEICAAISPKAGNQLGAGTLSYSWTVNGSTAVPTDAYNYPSSGTTPGIFNYFIASSSLESGYNVMTSSSPAGYTTQAGAQAFSSLITFMNKRLVAPGTRYHPYMLRDFVFDNALLKRSVSAFAATSIVAGGGVTGGYWNTLASSETTIKHRKFSCFSEDKQLDRGFRQHAQTAGDANWLVGSLLLQQSKLEMRNPNPPILVPVDFYEFIDCLAMFASTVFTMYYHANNNNTTDIPNLGLTITEFVIIMRKILMRNFGATQQFVQSLRFYPLSLGSTDDFLPLLANSCGSSSSFSASLKLPLFAVENMSALRARTVFPSVNPKTKKQIDIYPRYYVPVLGIYSVAVLQTDRYKFTDSNGNLQDLFIPSSDVFNPVDCSLNGKYIDADCSPKITTDMDKWNVFMDTMSSNIQQPQTYTGDPGCIPLTVIGDTRMIIQRKIESEKKKKKDDKCDEKECKKKRDPRISTFDKVYVGTCTLQVPISDIAPIKKSFIMPEIRVFKSNLGVGTVTSSYWRSSSSQMWFEYEGQRFAGSDDGDYTPMEDIRKQWVSHCVKGMTADNDTIVKQLIKLTEQGKAGLLGTLVGVFGGEMLNTAARTLGSFIPI